MSKLKTIEKISKKLLVFAVIFALCCGIITGTELTVTYADEIADMESQIAANEQKIKDLENKINNLSGEVNATQSEQDLVAEKIQAESQTINLISNQIAVLVDEIAYKEKLIADAEDKIQLKNEEIADLQVEIDDNLARFAKLARALYITKNEDMLSVIMGSGDIYEILIRSDVVQSISKQNIDFMDALLADIKGLEDKKVQLQNDIAELENDKADLQSDLDELNSKKTLSEQKNNELQKEYDKYGAQLANIQEAQYAAMYEKQATQNEIEAFEKEIQRIIEENARKDMEYVGGDWQWPMPGYHTVSSRFGERFLGSSTWHSGNDISGYNAEGVHIYGQPIVAANDGVVIKAQDYYTPGYSYGKYVVIDHGGGYTSLYGHCSALNVYEGQEVKRGDTIAFVGNTGYSFGAHLHFEIRIDGVAQDSLAYYPADLYTITG